MIASSNALDFVGGKTGKPQHVITTASLCKSHVQTEIIVNFPQVHGDFQNWPLQCHDDVCRRRNCQVTSRYIAINSH
jgi:hypothetical protein